MFSIKVCTTPALSDVKKTLATNVATGDRLSPHLLKCIWENIGSLFYLYIFSLGPHNEEVSIIIICHNVLITDSFVHKLSKNLKRKAKNMKFKKLCWSPHLNCLTPHVAIGEKVEHRSFIWRSFIRMVFY